ATDYGGRLRPYLERIPAEPDAAERDDLDRLCRGPHGVHHQDREHTQRSTHAAEAAGSVPPTRCGRPRRDGPSCAGHPPDVEPPTVSRRHAAAWRHSTAPAPG